MTVPAAPHRAPDPGLLAAAIADRVRGHPSVVGLHGGPHGTVASYLPGRRVEGVLIDPADGSVQLSVVLRLGDRLPEVVADLRRQVVAVTGPVPVNITVADVSTGDEDEHGTG